MEAELLPVVDEYDTVIDTLPRHVIHSQGLKHRAVHILVFNDQDSLFLQKRSMSKDLNAGLWDSSAAGHVDLGENYVNTAIREVREELGVSADREQLKPLIKLTPTIETGMEFVQVFCLHHNGPFDLAPDEIDEGKWLAKDRVSKRVHANDASLTETFKSIWRNIENNL